MPEDGSAEAHRALGESSLIKDSPGECRQRAVHFAVPDQAATEDPPRFRVFRRGRRPSPAFERVRRPGPRRDTVSNLHAVLKAQLNLVDEGIDFVRDPIILEKDRQKRAH